MVLPTTTSSEKKIRQQLSIPRACAVLLLLVIMWYRVRHRALEWMDSYPLLASSLKSCPRSAKSHLEMSKIYSGMVPSKFNLTQSLWHLQQAESIDPTYCDVHQQFAHVYVQQNDLVKFEQRLAKAILCPFSMQGAMEMWRRYWQQILATFKPENLAAQRRLRRYEELLQEAVKRETVAEGTKPQWMGGRLNDEDLKAIYEDEDDGYLE
jgi:hypothetical protein